MKYKIGDWVKVQRKLKDDYNIHSKDLSYEEITNIVIDNSGIRFNYYAGSAYNFGSFTEDEIVCKLKIEEIQE